MPKSSERFHSNNGKRSLLVVDDEQINRELLGLILQDSYELTYASDGEEAMRIIKEKYQTLSLILLDLIMPKISGLDILRWIKGEPELQHIPIIVLTADQSAEVESLRLGAIDFIPKPYPQSEVILARVQRTIELSEDRDIIQSTERDNLTGLFNKEYFYRYAEQYDLHHKDTPMDAIVVDVNHFHMINERYGKDYGNEVLSRIGLRVREMVQNSGGIVCRRGADTFLVYCPHGKDYQAILDNASKGLAGDKDASDDRVRLRMGVYCNVDKDIDIERRFDRAKMAADTVRNSFSCNIAIYDKGIHESELYAEQLLEDFQRAIDEHQFKVYYQPKFNIRTEVPVLSSAEALVRWQHPTLGLISPGVFIPLFENNGLIQRLDMYVWRETAAQIRDWRDRFDISVPVSVNVSRIDMYDPQLVDILCGLVKEFDLTPKELLLEITESAYTQDSEQIVHKVDTLRELGFKIEMDDFGTGYSSLSMISSLPIDALKLDMVFIRNAFGSEKDIRMLELIIDIADYLGVPVIAEGVETEEQFDILRKMGCDIVQGYYFSRPVPADEYEQFVENKKNLSAELRSEYERHAQLEKEAAKEDVSYVSIAHALSSGFESIYYVDFESGHYVEFSSQGSYDDLQIDRSGSDFFGDTQKNILRVVYPEDQARVAAFMKKETLLSQLVADSRFSMTYRLLINGAPAYYNLKVILPSTKDNHHLVIGVSNVDDLTGQSVDYEKIQARNQEFYHIAQALSSDFETIYYVDTATGKYTKFIKQGLFENLQIETSGDDFFAESQQNMVSVVYPDDYEKFARGIRKENLLAELSQRQVYTLDYRLMIDGEPIYCRMKVVPAAENRSRYIVVGVSNISGEIERIQEYEEAQRSSVTYARIADALAQDYVSIYYVDLDTDEFIEYCPNRNNQLHLEKSGRDFFGDCCSDILKSVFDGDKEKALAVWNKKNISDALAHSTSFSTSYRLMVERKPIYVSVKVVRMPGRENNHIIIAVNNIDEQMKREKEFAEAQEAALKDSMTGVKNKRAYSQEEQRLNSAISKGTAGDFGIVICDVNGLKQVNDTMGHQAGDEFIRNACMEICHIFQHSPVFRIGGDEFVVILRGMDYQNRKELIDKVMQQNSENVKTDSVTIACGMSEYVPEQDSAVSAVFERADVLMYENKKQLKADR